MQVVTALRALGLPVARLHSDRGGEFVTRSLRLFSLQHCIGRTTTAGDNALDFRQHGRCLKRQARTLLQAYQAPVEHWAFAMRHSAARLRAYALSLLGLPQPALLPWYTQVVLRTRTWNSDQWSSRAPFPSTGVRDECAPFPSTGVRDECAPIPDTGVRKVSAPKEDQGGALQPSTGVGNMRETCYRAQQAIPSLPYAGANHRTSWDHPFRVHPSWPPPKQPPISMRTPDPMWGGPAGHYHQVIPSHVKSDFWLHDRARGVVIRFHAKSRRFMFNPAKAKLPDDLTTEAMTGRRRTLAMADTESQRVEDNWKSDATVDLQFVWVGRTEFELDES